ncbi:hypothetical protein Micbo1qcDRAFT_236398 [Microdochium bolleyi]|uniref:C2H2-type domain-containing protein n=1 Tax=Microdochium bolleyi TaxID=196109 RepID=A0A136IRI3_9PEZI|nr:hypothetical protein Micbo1qcDRAFT_236398 [Microdochium bolleyi]
MVMHVRHTKHVKPYACQQCAKGFTSESGLSQHAASHVAAGPVPFGCSNPRCKKTFTTQDARDQHMASTRHGKPHSCQQCGRGFATASALADHASAKGHAEAGFESGINGARSESAGNSSSSNSSGSPILTPAMSTPEPASPALYRCHSCERTFKAQAALDMHFEVKHVNTCRGCRRGFATESALEQHMQSTSHRAGHDNTRAGSALLFRASSFSSGSDTSWHTTPSGRSTPAGAQTGLTTSGTCVANELALAMASSLRLQGDKAPLHTPLDVFFRAFDGFAHDPKAPIHISFERLRRHLGHKLTAQKLTSVRKDLHKAFDRELEEHYGGMRDLGAWQTMCQLVAGDEPGRSITACKKILNNIHVNIFDLVDYARSGAARSCSTSADTASQTQQPARELGIRLKTFSSVKALKTYSKKNGKLFPLEGGAKRNGDRSAALRAFLRFFHIGQGMIGY